MRRFRRRSVGSSYLHIGKEVCNICQYSLMGSSLYVVIIGLFGTAITAIDIFRVLNCKPNESLPTRSKIPTQRVEIERDLKLMTSVLGIEHYTLMMVGVITEYPMLHVPWLLMQLVVIAIELCVFCVRIFLEGLHVTRDEIILSVLTIHNWLQVFCLFHSESNRSSFF